MLEYLTTPLEIISRGGGGGSGGGDGDSGGIFLLGFFPPFFVTSFVMKRFGHAPAFIVGAPVAIIWGGLLLVIFGAGFIGLGMFIASIIGFGAGFTGLHSKLIKRNKKTKAAISNAAALDSAWDLESMKQRVNDVFYAYQSDWSNYNTQNISSYTSQYFSYHNWLMLTALHQLGRQNVVENPELKEIKLVDAVDHADNTKDSFSAYISAKATDKLIDTRANEVIFTDKRPFEEFWNFTRDPQKGWVLTSIDQVTARITPKTAQVSAFAANNNLYFNVDWGWLLLPKLGNIFSKADFKKSDVNNHCIGMLGNELVQLYTYVPMNVNNASNAQEITVSQIAVPRKNYGRIVIEQKSNWFANLFKRTPKGLNKLKVEAKEINDRFNIYASDVEQVTTFELLNPLYMQEVIDRPGKINIEVYDNTIFIYTRDKKFHYDDLFYLLQKAHKELVR